MQFSYKGRALSIPDETLLERGFVAIDGGFSYECLIADDKMRFLLLVKDELTTQVFDLATGDPYILYRLPRLKSGFAYAIKIEIDAIIDRLFPELSIQAFPYSSKQFQMLHAALAEMFNEPADFPFEEKDIGVLRLANKGKWYGIVMPVQASKIGLDSDATIGVINLRVAKGQAPSLADHRIIFPAYHMNKQNWVTIVLDDKTKDDELLRRLIESRKYVIEGK